MTLEVIKLEPKPRDPRQIIETLEELVNRAKEGEFEAVVAVCLRPDDTFLTRSSGYPSSLELIGALYAAQHDILKATEK